MNDLTILIPTKNRHAFLVRLLRYLDRIFYLRQEQPRIFIADGSSDDVFALNAGEIEQSALSITHWQPPKDINTSKAGNCRFFYIPRMALAIDEIKTPYVQLLCDDSFVGAEFLDRAIWILGADPGISTVVGQTWVLSLDEDRDTTRQYGSITGMHLAEMTPPKYAATALERVMLNPDFGALNNSIWSMWRREVLSGYLKAGFAATQTLFTGIPGYMPGLEEEWTLDFIHGMMAPVFQLIAGNVAYVPKMMFGHQVHGNNLGLHLFRGPKFQEAAARPYFGLIVGSYLSSAAALLIGSGAGAEAARIAVAQGLWSHMARRLPGWIEERRTRVLPPEPVSGGKRAWVGAIPGLRPAAKAISIWHAAGVKKIESSLMEGQDIVLLRRFLEAT